MRKQYSFENPVQITRTPKEVPLTVSIAENLNIMDEDVKLLASLAAVLEYPTEDWNQRFEECKELSLLSADVSTDAFSDFCLKIRSLSLMELQELYTRTFDLKPMCALDVGHHLFGEDYKRGEFLANLKETEAPFDLGQEHQLPDFLPVLLRLLGYMENGELRSSLVAVCLISALEKMKASFKDQEHPYKAVILFVSDVLKNVAEKSILEVDEMKNSRYQYA